MTIIGIGLLGVAVVAVVVGLYQRSKLRQIAAAEPATCGQLRDELGQAGAVAPTPIREVTGVAQPGPEGPLTSKLASVSCVWHRHVVRRRYSEYVTNSQGRRTRRERTRQVAEFTSSAPFTLSDGTGSLLVVPDQASVDRPERVAKEFTPGQTSERLVELGASLLLGARDEGTIGYEHEEWAVRPGTHLYVLGEVSMVNGEPRIGKPAKGRFLLSTRSKAELSRSARRFQAGALAVAGAAGVAGAALLVAGVVV